MKIAQNMERGRETYSALLGVDWTVVRVRGQELNEDIHGRIQAITEALTENGWPFGGDHPK